MKKIKYLSLIIAVFSMQIACTSEIMTYDGEAGIYFSMTDASNKDALINKSIIPFVLTESTDSVFLITVKTVGQVASFDRSVKVEVVADSTDMLPGDYDPLLESYTMKAGEIYTQLPIKFHRQVSLKDKERSLKIRLVSSSDFSVLLGNISSVNVLEHKITISDKFVKLPGFNEYFFGTYSEKKMKLICTLFNMKLSDFEEKLEYVRAKALGQNLDKYLKEMKAKGQTVYEDYLDENGNKVEMTAGAGINI